MCYTQMHVYDVCIHYMTTCIIFKVFMMCVFNGYDVCIHVSCMREAAAEGERKRTEEGVKR